MVTIYKLTTKDWKTRKGICNETQWGPGVTHSGTGKGELCSDGYIHAYTHPLLAVLLNSIHANIENPVLWECTGDVALSDHGLKVGCVSLTTVRETPLPIVSTEERVRFAILCALEVYQDAGFEEWAKKWLDGTDRTAAAEAYAAAAVTYAAAMGAAEAAAAYATYAAAAAAAARAAAAAVRAAAAMAAAAAVRAAEKKGGTTIDLAKLAIEAVTKVAL